MELWLPGHYLLLQSLKEGKAFITATYNLSFAELDFPAFESAEELAEKAMELPFENRVLAVGIIKERGWELSFRPRHRFSS